MVSMSYLRLIFLKKETFFSLHVRHKYFTCFFSCLMLSFSVFWKAKNKKWSTLFFWLQGNIYEKLKNVVSTLIYSTILISAFNSIMSILIQFKHFCCITLCIIVWTTLLWTAWFHLGCIASSLDVTAFNSTALFSSFFHT